eukprot:scaffold89827_cov18-Tisochrysis_lutea.AAC.1
MHLCNSSCTRQMAAPLRIEDLRTHLQLSLKSAGIRTSMQPVQRRRPINTRAIDVNLIATLAERTGMHFLCVFTLLPFCHWSRW